jgi:hypothetical protein
MLEKEDIPDLRRSSRSEWRATFPCRPRLSSCMRSECLSGLGGAPGSGGLVRCHRSIGNVTYAVNGIRGRGHRGEWCGGRRRAVYFISAGAWGPSDIPRHAKLFPEYFWRIQLRRGGRLGVSAIFGLCRMQICYYSYQKPRC